MHKFFFVFVILLSGCSAQHNSNKLATQLLEEKPQKILSVLQEDQPDTSDFAQYYLNLGYLQLLSGQFEPAINSLESAKQEMQLLSAISISENIAAGTVNETFRRYSGYPTDRVMVHNMLALSYLFNQDIDGARVEMLQADVEMKKLAEDDNLNGQLVSAHLLSAVIYELLDERSNSFISYQFAEKVLTKRKVALPEGLKSALVRMSYKMGNDQQYEYYHGKYPTLVNKVNAKKQLFAFYFDGVVDHKQQASITVPSFSGRQLVRVSVPTYPNLNNSIEKLAINDNNQRVNSELIENIDTLVREDLDKEYPSILLLTTTRAIAKYQAVNEANKHDPLLGAVLNFATLLSEVADLRSWNMLPASIQFGYIETNSDEIELLEADGSNTTVNLNLGKQHVVLATSLSDQVFHYQQ